MVHFDHKRKEFTPYGFTCERWEPMLMLRPLIGFDKKDSMALARRLGTLAESEHSVPDSCTVFAPADPATSAKFYRIEREESRLDVPGLIHACLDATRQVDLATFERLPLAGLHDAADAVLRLAAGTRPPAPAVSEL